MNLYYGINNKLRKFKRYDTDLDPYSFISDPKSPVTNDIITYLTIKGYETTSMKGFHSHNGHVITIGSSPHTFILTPLELD